MSSNTDPFPLQALDDAISWFTRNTATGALAFGGMVKDGVAGVDGLSTVNGLAVSSDGKHIYVAACAESAVTWFIRDTSSGALQFGGMKKQGVDGQDGLRCATRVTISPDDKHVYVGASWDNAISWFIRNASSGVLKYGGRVENGVNGVNGLLNVNGLTVAPDGKSVFAVAANLDSVSWFTRDTSSGAISYGGLLKDGVGGVDGLDAAESVTVSPDGKQVYVAARNDDAVSWYALPLCASCAAGYACPSDGIQAMLPCPYAPSGAIYCGCASGKYGPNNRYHSANGCQDCAAGRYGNVGGLTSSLCAGACAAGKYSAGGATDAQCPGTCAAGRYGTGGSSNDQCSGGCAAGRYGTGGSTDAQCTGPCPAGSYSAEGTGKTVDCHWNTGCPAGRYQSGPGRCSWCPVGKYSDTTGSSACLPCPGGRYGNTTGSTTNQCSGACAAGRYGTAGSTNGGQCSICSAGKWSAAGENSCENCPGGRYGNSSGLTTNQCSGVCAAGRYGSGLGSSTSKQCDGKCYHIAKLLRRDTLLRPSTTSSKRVRVSKYVWRRSKCFRQKRK